MSNKIGFIVCAECGRKDVSALAKICPNELCKKDPHPESCTDCGGMYPKSQLKNCLCSACAKTQADALEQKLISKVTGTCECCEQPITLADYRKVSSANTYQYCNLDDGYALKWITHEWPHSTVFQTKWWQQVDCTKEAKMLTSKCSQCGHPITWFTCACCGEEKLGTPVKTKWKYNAIYFSGGVHGDYQRVERDAFLCCCAYCEPKAKGIASLHQEFCRKKTNSTMGGSCLFMIMMLGSLLGVLLSLVLCLLSLMVPVA